MRSWSHWQTWRQRCLPLARSILDADSASLPRLPLQCLPRQFRACSLRASSTSAANSRPADQAVSKDVEARKREIEEADVTAYPQYARSEESISSFPSFVEKFNYLKPGELQELDGSTGSSGAVVEGRIHSVRTGGSKLAFLDVTRGAHEVLQVVLNARLLPADDAAFKKARQLLRRGDLISTGDDEENLERHVELLTNKDAVKTLVLRSAIIQKMRDFFRSESFLEVQTPILAGAAGGASARPFETTAVEFPNRKLSMRIAPELWLKRLIIGGMERVFEIGPSFRNEGLDKTHNPEFTTCEFYSTYTSILQLRRLTERLIRSIATHVSTTPSNGTYRAYGPPLSAGYIPGLGNDPFPEIDFIPALNTALGQELPNLASENARLDLVRIFEQKSLPLPAKATVPRLLDKLSSVYLESTSPDLTFIVNHPACMSPLSKSFIHPTAPNAQPVAARAELFVLGREIVNCYEEENSPFEQRRKFMMQQRHASEVADTGLDDEVMSVDEDYLRALEWGLPPTGGWGCGIDRLVMLFAGKERIGDVLSFGNLRAVTRGAERKERTSDRVDKVVAT